MSASLAGLLAAERTWAAPIWAPLLYVSERPVVLSLTPLFPTACHNACQQCWAGMPLRISWG